MFSAGTKKGSFRSWLSHPDMLKNMPGKVLTFIKHTFWIIYQIPKYLSKGP